jgi:hypothetical protein
MDDATKRLKMAGTHLFNAGEVALAEMVHVRQHVCYKEFGSADGRKRIKYGTRGLLAES